MAQQQADWRRWLIPLASQQMVARWLAGWLPQADRIVVSRSAGKYSLTSLVTGLPLVWLSSTGARSGQQRLTPLLAIPYAEDLIIIASNFGQPQLPAWYHNLRANPQAEVSGRQIARRRVTAREVSGAERAELWSAAATLYPGYDAYANYAGRTIPVIRLERRD